MSNEPRATLPSTPFRYRRWPVRVRFHISRLHLSHPRSLLSQHGIHESWDGAARVCTRVIRVGPILLIFGDGRSVR